MEGLLTPGAGRAAGTPHRSVQRSSDPAYKNAEVVAADQLHLPGILDDRMDIEDEELMAE